MSCAVILSEAKDLASAGSAPGAERRSFASLRVTTRGTPKLAAQSSF
jgi:hypothetical protein